NTSFNPVSSGSLVQFFSEPDAHGQMQLKGVINHQVPGYGKLLSRYLHFMDDKVLSETISWNQKTQDTNELLVENCDHSHFNANIHPSLMPYEISSHGSQNRLP